MRNISDIKKYTKLLAGLAITSMVMAGCTLSDDYFSPDDETGGGGKDGKTIEFYAQSSSVTSKAAPGHPIDGTAFPANQSFGVLAYQIGYSSPGTVEKFMNPDIPANVAFDNQKVSSDISNKITYSPKISWPGMQGGKTLRFFAYYPWVDQVSPLPTDPDIKLAQAPSQEKVELTYALSGDPSKHVDLMYWMGSRIGSSNSSVQVGFNHALTRLKFHARHNGYPVGTDIKVTRITIREAATKGVLAVTGVNSTSTSAQWTPSPTVKDPISMTTANGLAAGLSLTKSFQSVLVSDKSDMLVIPQSVNNIELDITAEIDGVSKTFTRRLNGTQNWGMNNVFTYQITLDWEGIDVTAIVTDEWTPATVNTIFDGQYYLRTSNQIVSAGSAACSPVVTLETDYDGNYNGAGNSGYPAGLVLDDTQTANWCSVSKGSNIGVGGIYKHVFTVTLSQYNSGTQDRSTSFKVKAGNMSYTISVIQSYQPWLKVTPSSSPTFPLNNMEHSFTVESNTLWEIISVTDPNGILVPDRQWVGRKGGQGGLTSVPFYFFFKATATAGQNANVTIKDITDSNNPNVVVQITTSN